ncbi:caffeic acid 3-O-methyltransferase-like [Telopea speciosissima]|uniref:caffeic acid 3-O-methyltransferase-like n=1 Tax=Telopea speciosissima TaxID=54955 RepID=UPI001CC7294B|nr:caffeic acid 3-O-methyltransferase-like [Telopea speciosissima]
MAAASTDENNQPKPSTILAMEMPSAVVFPMVFKAAMELDLLEIIARDGPDAQLSPSMIASQLQTQNPDAPEMVDRIMRLLASYSMLTCSLVTHEDGRVERLYGLAPVSTHFLANNDAPFAGLLKALNHKVFLQSWHHLKDAVLEGGTPFVKANGISVYDYAATDPNFNESFNTAMLKGTMKTMNVILEKYKGLENAKVVVDVGGGIGAALELITSKYPKIKGINFDLPHVVHNAPTYPGVEHVGGDMFVSVPAGDIILLKAVLHNWGDDDCLKILKNCYEALPEHGKVVVIDRVLPIAPETTVDAKACFRLDLIMLAQHAGGKERTEREFEMLSKGAGFIGFKLIACVNHWVMEFYKTHIHIGFYLPNTSIMDMRKIACVVIVAAASMSAVMAHHDESPAPAPAPTNAATVGLPLVGTMVGASVLSFLTFYLQ